MNEPASKSPPTLSRCAWCGTDPLYVTYHDNEWGRPVQDDQRLFEMLTLEGAQAGLSWITILRKREGYRKAFHNFDPERVAAMTQADQLSLLSDDSIVRNRLKIASTVTNARAFLDVQKTVGSFSQWYWKYTEGGTILNAWESMDQIPSSTELSQQISRDLKRLGFRFVGPTIVYAFMQATGMVNDHVTTCHRYPH
jgi:DNA-3-methyladenine glycosylase I